MWARAAPSTCGCTRLKTSPGFIPASTPRLRRRAAPLSMCSSRNREHREVVLGVEQPGLLVPPVVTTGQDVLDPLQQLVDVGLLDHRLDGQAGDEPDHAERVQVAEGVAG